MDTSARTLRLLNLLQSHRLWTGDELADRLGVSVRTVRRDVDRLRELGYPVEAARGIDGGYQLAAGAALPPLVLDDEEAVALAVGLQSMAGAGAPTLAEASVRVLAKVVQVMPSRLRHRVEALMSATDTPSAWGWRQAPSLDPDALVVVARACRDRERMSFRYTSADGTASERDVEPMRLVPIQRRWYLVAYDVGRGDFRTFRMDRLSDPQPRRTFFRPRELPADDAVEFVRAGLRRARQNLVVEALVQAGADRVRKNIGPWAEVTEIDAGSCRLHLEVDSLGWPALVLGSLGAEFTILEPEDDVGTADDLRALLADWSQRFARAAG